MAEAMGMYVLISHNATPTTISATTMFIKGIRFILPGRQVTIRAN
jgi:hypothetical protein